MSNDKNSILSKLKELQSIFHTPIDLVPDSNKFILKELINV